MATKTSDRRASDVAADVLRRARVLIRKPEAWLNNGYFCAGADGQPLRYADEGEACRFCVRGAIYRAEELLHVNHTLAEHYMREAVGRTALAVWNDDVATHAAVLAAFDRAIELAEAA